MEAQYKERVKKGEEKTQQYHSFIQKMALSRLAVILGGGALLFYLSQQEVIWLFLLAFLGILILFMYLVFKQSQLDKQKEYWEKYTLINQNELQVLKGGSNLYDAGEKWENSSHPFTSDLDVFGKNSLFQLVNRASTYLGNVYLAEKFSRLIPKNCEEVVKVQNKVKDLSQDIDWCQNYQIALLTNNKQDVNPLPILEYYLKKAPSFLPIKLFTIWVKISPFFIFSFLIGGFFNTSFWGIAIILGLLQVFISFYYGGKVSLWTQHAENIGKITESYVGALRLIEEREKNNLGYASFHKLNIIIQKLNARNNPFVGLILNFLFLWDIKYILEFEKWRNGEYESVFKGIELTSIYEFNVSLATLCRNEPEWTFPHLVKPKSDFNTLIFEADQIEHPLLNKTQSVANSYHNENHKIALITGSNMAGKSTFLRTAGANLVLAYLGAPVRANYLKTSLFRMITSMRIKDSLAESTSTFKAELDRISWVLKESEIHKETFVLIDEMLRGTNSVDKFLGSKAIIEKLIKQGTYGLIATHDLQLSELEQQYPGKMANFHFDIKMEGSEMKFDYKLKQGPCTQFNAAILLKNIGIDINP